MTKKFNLKISDFLIASFIVLGGLAFANAQSITVTAVPVQQVINGQFITFGQNGNYQNKNNGADIINVPAVNNHYGKTVCGGFNSLLQKGMTGVNVLKLQKLLNQDEKAGIAENGVFDTATENAVKNFQYKYGLNVTGIVWIETNFALNQIDCCQMLPVIHADKYVTATVVVKTVKTYKHTTTIPVKKAVKVIKAVMYDKAGNVVMDAVGAPKYVNYGSKMNIKQNVNTSTNTNLNQMVKIGMNAMNKASTTVASTTTVLGNTVAPSAGGITNFINNFWTNYKANFTKKTFFK